MSLRFMASVNPLSRELVFKIVYYGPGLGGKTTTLEHIHATAKPDHRGKLVSLATPVDRTLYFDFLPMRLPPIRGMHVRLQLFTVPGQVYFNATRKLVLTGADGIVFVADSQTARADANLESLDNLRDNLADQGRNLSDVPIVFQYNKHDLPDVLSVDELDKQINRWNAPSLATSARTGLGVYESLERITHAVLASFETQMPESVRVSAAAAFDPNEEGLAAALRGASQGEDRPPTSGAIFNRVVSSRVTLGSLPPETGTEDSPPVVDKAAMRAAGLPVTTFPDVPEDGWGAKEKLTITAPSEASILTRAESGRAHTGRSPESRSGETPRSRNRPSVLPPKPFAPLIPHAAPPRTPATHAPAAPPNATTSTAKEHVTPLATAHAPSPPANATTSASKEPTRHVTANAPTAPPNATAATSDTAFAPVDKAPTTEKTVAVPAKAPAPAPIKAEVVAAKPAPTPVKIEVAPAKPEPAPVKIEVAPAKPAPETLPVAVPTAAGQKQPLPFERLDPTQLLSIADLLEPPPEVTRQPQPAPQQAAKIPTPEVPLAQVQRVAAVPPADTTGASKRVPTEPDPTPKVAPPKPAELQPLPARAPSAPATASATPTIVEASAPVAPTLAAPVVHVAITPVTPVTPVTTDAVPAASPLVPARSANTEANVQSPLTSKDSPETNLRAASPLPVEKTDARKSPGLSFADLWPEADRALVHEVETAIAAGRCSEAIDLADTLVGRVLTSTATLFGSTDATRDAASMPLLLGIDGRRFLAFRSIVRASRSGAKASPQDALAAYAFAIEARMAKGSIR